MDVSVVSLLVDVVFGPQFLSLCAVLMIGYLAMHRVGRREAEAPPYEVNGKRVVIGRYHVWIGVTMLVASLGAFVFVAGFFGPLGLREVALLFPALAALRIALDLGSRRLIYDDVGLELSGLMVRPRRLRWADLRRVQRRSRRLAVLEFDDGDRVVVTEGYRGRDALINEAEIRLSADKF
ncbi:MAG: PH domain-containing protein [Pseudomonadota bacterium]